MSTVHEGGKLVEKVHRVVRAWRGLRVVLDAERRAVEVSHICLNDHVVEGLRARDARAFSVQYHPEAAAGPHDAEYLFDQFIDLMAGER